MGDALVVTNGDQTDTIVEAGDFRAGCMQREYEPDAPNFTPRISAIVNPDGSFRDVHLEARRWRPLHPRVLRLRGRRRGLQGYFISTYQGDGNPLPTFAGEPIPVTLPTPDAAVGRAERRQQGEPVRQRRRRSDPLQQEPRGLKMRSPSSTTVELGGMRGAAHQSSSAASATAHSQLRLSLAKIRGVLTERVPQRLEMPSGHFHKARTV